MNLNLPPIGELIGATPTEPKSGDTSERAQVVRLAEEFEAMLVLQMLRQMRASMLDEESDEVEGLGADVFTDTIDQEVARHLSRAGGFGLAPMITEAFDRSTRGVDVTTSAGLSTPAAGGSPVQAPAIPGQSASSAAFSSSSVASAPSSGIAIAPVEDGTRHAHIDSGLPDTSSAVSASSVGSAQVTSSFGWRSDPFHGRSKFHAGVDLKAAYGRPVPVVSDGTVKFAGEQGAYGLTVVVDHGGGLTTRYAHLSSLDVKSGDQLNAGQVVGLVGQTGRATGPHLHFEVRHQGEVVDPQQAGRRFEAAGLKLVALDVD